MGGAKLKSFFSLILILNVHRERQKAVQVQKDFIL